MSDEKPDHGAAKRRAEALADSLTSDYASADGNLARAYLDAMKRADETPVMTYKPYPGEPVRFFSAIQVKNMGGQWVDVINTVSEDNEGAIAWRIAR